jgi:hypothetical protein
MKRAHLTLAVALALAPHAVGADPEVSSLPFELDPRPFLLVDAPRRYAPGEPAFVRVQKAHGGPVQVGVFRLRALASFVAERSPRQGVSIAEGAVGAEAEALLVRDGALPRRGGLVDLVALQRVVLRVRPPVRRARGDETAVYDSNESDEGAAETWGVDAGDWADERVPLGGLAAGVYLVRAHAGGWAATSLVSVSSLTVLARRGDARDVVSVVNAEGAPQGGVTVQRFVAGRPGELARTDAQGTVSFAAVDAQEARYVAVRGDDVAWADVTHVRAEPCDVRVYVGVGRPAFRPGETVNVRGHARGCVDGREAPLRDEPVELRVDEAAERVTARTDGDGNFVAEVAAGAEVFARVRGRDHRRTLHLDTRPLPRRALRVRFDRTWAAAGERVTATASDDAGGWPDEATVTFHTPGGEGRERVGPGRAASFTFTMPATDEALARVNVSAELSAGGATTYAAGELWTGAWRDLLELTTEATRGEPERDVAVSLAVKDLGGVAREGAVAVRVFGSDGNRPVGAARWTQTFSVTPASTGQRVRLAGAGPWWIEAAPAGDVRASKASLVVWERERPPALSARGALAVSPLGGVAVPGRALPLMLRAPAEGSTWLTLEQGGVWGSRWSGSGASGRFELPVGEGARGLATVVATHLHAGAVTYASAAVEVETSRRFGLRVSTSQRTYPAGATARVTVAARNDDGAPRDAVVSLWVADAGWWEIAEEDHPSPDDFFKLPGRRASAGDSAHPVGYGAEEGRRLDTTLEWNGRRLPGTTFRHAWGHTSELLRFDLEGTFGDIARRMARDAGLAGAEVCSDTERSLGRVRVKVRGAPWDMAAARIGAVTETTPLLIGRVLHFDCNAGLSGSGAGGGGTGSGMGRGSGTGRGSLRAQSLDGTVFFLGTRRLGPGGAMTLDVPLPDHPGRWRVEALAIADDGAGTSANAVASTSLPVEARVELPSTLAVGDEAVGALAIEAPTLARREVSVEATLSEGLALATPLPARLTLDAGGHASMPVTVRASAPGEQSITLRAASAADAGVGDGVRFPVRVRNDPARQPVRVDTVVGPEATDVELRVPALAAPSTLTVRLGGTLDDGVAAVLAALREPRWNVASLRLDRVMSLAALRGVVAEPALRARRADLYAEVDRALAGEWAALREHMGAAGGVSWWRRMRPSPRLTAELLWVGSARLDLDERRDAVAVVREALTAPQTSLAVVARCAAALSAAAQALVRAEAEPLRVLARTSIDRAVAGGDVDALTWALRAARSLDDDARARAAGAAMAVAVDRSVANHPVNPCAGAAWFVCMETYGDRALVARAASELVRLDAAHRPLAARALAWIVRNPTIAPGPRWGAVEADVVALHGAMAGTDAARDASVRLDGREIARVRSDAATRVTVPREGVLTVSFARDEGRATRVAIEGELLATAPTTTVGPGALVRRIETNGGAAELVVEFTLPAAARDVEVGVPLPAAYLPALRAGANDFARETGGRGADRWGFDLARWDFYALDRTPAQSRARVEYVDGALHVRYAALLAGRHTLRVPLTTTARGRFGAGAAWMRADGARVWSVTPAMTAEVR